MFFYEVQWPPLDASSGGWGSPSRGSPSGDLYGGSPHSGISHPKGPQLGVSIKRGDIHPEWSPSRGVSSLCE